MFVLGVSWLVLTPLCLWNLFRGGTLVRLTSVLALVSLEMATIWTTSTVRIPPRTLIAAPSPSAARIPAPGPPAGPASEPAPAPQAAQQGARDVRSASCPGRMPAPERVRLARRQGALRGVTLFWTARADECDTATVVLRHRNRTIRVWVRDGETDGRESRASDATTRPVSVTGGVASLQVLLAQPVRGEGGFRAVDGRTGRPIALG
ncbi:hypothetical protein ACFQVD_22445 [Streptosporangium amethystogenes subsp. fukuiense]|uniref:Integral membrane protein n=1 Tax=Streptosporangium amethystogenes subsp. fukuiense TaxID=698418 RepID=A0ABW2T4E0_9ACTN